MKIVYDNIVFSLQRAGGISVVWYELLKRMLKNDSKDILFIEYRNANQNIFRNKLALPIQKYKVFLDRFLFFVRYINPSLRKLKEPFIFHSSYYRISSNINAINITTVHDFIYEKFRTGIKKEIHCYQKKRSILKSDLIICVSENTKNDLLSYYPNVNPQKVFIVHNGVSDEYNEKKRITDDLPFLTLNYIIYVGVRDEYKRFDIAIECAKQLNTNLVIVGGGKLSKKEMDYINSNLREDQYKAFTNISNSQLNALYSNALCLIYPSAYEGFGIPIIEAQKSGCPVLAYNNGAMKEIIGITPLLFNNFDMKEIIHLIQTNLFNLEKRTKIIESGLINAQNYSWDITYNKTLEIYNLLTKNNFNTTL